MAKYRKKPVVIEAFQMTAEAFANDGGAIGQWPDWAQKAVETSGPCMIHMHGPNGIACKIITLEGEMDCSFNDWIIKGVKGELYPCKPDIFAATYEPAGE
jgi:hypothetical protein